jgi:hypothetical protein
VSAWFQNTAASGDVGAGILRVSSDQTASSSLVMIMVADPGNERFKVMGDGSVYMTGDFSLYEKTAPAVSAANQGKIYFDSTDDKFKVSENGGAFRNLVTTNSVKRYHRAAKCVGGSGETLLETKATNTPTPVCYTTAPNARVFGALEFPDAAGTISYIFDLIPSDWDSSNVNVKIIWYAPSASANDVWWRMHRNCIDAGEVLEDSTGNGSYAFAGTNGGNNVRNVVELSSNFSLIGCSPGEHVIVQLERLGGNASDTLAASAYLLGVELTYNLSP